jgi:hypothetical protein
MEVSLFIVCKYLGFEIQGTKNPRPGTMMESLKNVNYNIDNATRSEILASFITIITIISFILSITILIAYSHFYPEATPHSH